jgi:hypothetical protein
MLESRLTAEARTVLGHYGSDNPIEKLLPLWCDFEVFLQTLQVLPPSIREIPEASLRAYAALLQARDCHVDDALVALSAVLLICLRAGYRADILRQIVIPRIRRPVENRQWDAFRKDSYKSLGGAKNAENYRRRTKAKASSGRPACTESEST